MSESFGFRGYDIDGLRSAEPVTLNPLQSVSVPMIGQMALLYLANDVISIRPEENPIVPDMRSVKLINISLYGSYLEEEAEEFGQQQADEFHRVRLEVINEQTAMTADSLNGKLAGYHYLMRGNSVTLGRLGSPNMRFRPDVSRRHLRVDHEGDRLILTDLVSTNGTRLQLHPDDALGIAD